jgi:di/tricarboxylate transporter
MERPGRLSADETKSAYKTTELMVAVVTAIAVLIASAIADDLDAHLAWQLVSFIAIGYMISRGLAKSGSRHWGYDEPGGQRPGDDDR